MLSYFQVDLEPLRICKQITLTMLKKCCCVFHREFLYFRGGGGGEGHLVSELCLYLLYLSIYCSGDGPVSVC